MYSMDNNITSFISCLRELPVRQCQPSSLKALLKHCEVENEDMLYLLSKGKIPFSPASVGIFACYLPQAKKLQKFLRFVVNRARQGYSVTKNLEKLRAMWAYNVSLHNRFEMIVSKPETYFQIGVSPVRLVSPKVTYAKETPMVFSESFRKCFCAFN